jgi:hypothetical protein
VQRALERMDGLLCGEDLIKEGETDKNVCPTLISLSSAAWLLFRGGGFGGLDFGGGVGVLFGEAFDAPCGINQLLFAGEEGVAIGADFDFEHVALDGRAGGEIVAAGAMDCYGVIVGMNTGFHEAPFVRVRSARLACSR